jgi:hypothetical protein
MTLWFRALFVFVLAGACLRVFFLFVYPQDLSLPGFSGIIFGLVNDAAAFAMVAGVVALAGYLGLYFFRAMVLVAIAVILIVGVAEVFFWQEFQSRLDRLVFHYLAFPKEVLVFLDEQFYLSLLILPFCLLVWVIYLGLQRSGLDSHRAQHRPLWIVMGLIVLIWGEPLGQSNGRVVSEFVSNGYLGVLKAARYREDGVAWLQQPQAGQILQRPRITDSSVDEIIKRELSQKRHVMLIIEESFAGPVWMDSVLREQYLPNFTKLSEQALDFSHMYAPGSRTTRGLEALLNGFMPLPGISTTQRAQAHKLPSLARGMQAGGFYPAFLYGGWPGFSNFSAYWQGMGFAQIWTREDFDEPFETSWGVADGALFDRILIEMSDLTQTNERVFLATLTVSHHRPYDIPSGKIDYPSDERSSVYAMAYADHALGEFFRAAKKEAWFKDTLFIVAADHGLKPQGDALIPVGSYRIPMLMFAEGMTPRKMSGMSSSISLPATLMHLFNIEHGEPFMGENLLCDCDTIVPVEYGYHIGLLEREYLHVVRADGQYAQWHYDATDLSQTLSPSFEVESVDARRRYRQRVIAAFAPAYQWFYGSDISGEPLL